MSTRSSVRNLLPPLDNPKLTIRRRSCTDPTLLNNSEMTAKGNGDLPVPDLQTMEELCQPSLNGRGGPISPTAIQEMNFGLKNDMIQQVQNSCQFHGLPGGTFMKRRLEECYDLIENMTALHNDWDTSAQQITPNCKTCGGPHSFSDCQATVGNTQNVYAVGAYQGNSYQPQGNRNLLSYRSDNYLGPPSFNQNQYRNNQNQNFHNQNMNQGNHNPQGNNQGRNQFFQKANQGTLLGNTITNPKEDLKGITTRSGTAYQGPMIPTTSSSSPVVERETEATKDTVHPTNNESTNDVQPSVVQSESLTLNSEPVISPIIEPVASLPIYQNSAVLLKKLPKKLGDPSKFLIPCDFPGMAECLALADLDASINLMPLSMWNKLSLPDLSPTCMTLELSDRLISHPVGVAEDVFIKVGTFHFSADFVVIYFDVDPRVPLILWRSFLKTGRALIDVFECQLTLRVGKEAITFNLDQNSRYSANYNDMTANRIDVIDMACEDDFLLEEVDAFLALEDDPTSPKVDQSYVDTEGNILLLEAFLNDDPSLPPPNQGNYLPQVRKEIKIYEAKSDKSSIDEPPDEKTALITVLKSHKRAIAWKLFDIKGIDPEFCTHKILMEEDFEPAVQHQRRINPKIHDVIKNEVLKLLDAGLIYPISDSPWVSPVHCVPKKGGFTIVENEENKLIPTRLVTGMARVHRLSNLFPPLDNPKITIRKRSRTDPTLLNNSEMAAEGNGDLPVPDLQTMKELCQPSLNGPGGPIAPIAIQATNFGLKNDMIQQV
nr:reverse transcriptase domain-containing protein [Tanacetum cinerariifolium]